MSVLDKDAFNAAIQARIGEDTTDEALEFAGNMMDTYNSLTASQRSETDVSKADLDALDAKWRAKYKARFFSGGSPDDSPDTQRPESNEHPEEKITIADLFAKKEG